MSCRAGIPTLLEGWVADAPRIEIEGLCFEAGRARAGEAYVHTGAGHMDEYLPGDAQVVICDGKTDLNGAAFRAIHVPGLDKRTNELAARFYRHPAQKIADTYLTHIVGLDVSAGQIIKGG